MTRKPVSPYSNGSHGRVTEGFLDFLPLAFPFRIKEPRLTRKSRKRFPNLSVYRLFMRHWGSAPDIYRNIYRQLIIGLSVYTSRTPEKPFRDFRKRCNRLMMQGLSTEGCQKQ